MARMICMYVWWLQPTVGTYDGQAATQQYQNYRTYRTLHCTLLQNTLQTQRYNQLTSGHMQTTNSWTSKIYTCKFCSDTSPHFNASWSVKNCKIRGINNTPVFILLMQPVPVNETCFQDSAKMTKTNFIKPKVPCVGLRLSTTNYSLCTLIPTASFLFKCSKIECDEERT